MKDPKTADTLRRLRELALRRMVRNGDAAALDELLRLAAGGALALPAPPTLQGTLDLYPSLAELVAEIDPKHVSTRWEAHTDAQGVARWWLYCVCFEDNHDLDEGGTIERDDDHPGAADVWTVRVGGSPTYSGVTFGHACALALRRLQIRRATRGERSTAEHTLSAVAAIRQAARGCYAEKTRIDALMEALRFDEAAEVFDAYTAPDKRGSPVTVFSARTTEAAHAAIKQLLRQWDDEGADMLRAALLGRVADDLGTIPGAS